jgi:polyphosphate kinase
MGRNLDRRVEVRAPVEDPSLQVRLDEILAVHLDADARAWALDASGDGRRCPAADGFSPQERLMELARQRALRQERNSDQPA